MCVLHVNKVTPMLGLWGMEFIQIYMIMSSNGNIFALPALCERNPPVDPLTKASEAGLWRFLWSVPEQTVEQAIKTPGIRDVIALIMTLSV